MAWDDKSKDPWSGRKKNDGPPDLDQLLKNFFRRLFGLKQPKPSAEKTPLKPKNLGMIIAIVVLVLIVLWIILGIYVVGPAEEAVVLRFGKYVGTESSGLHWIPRLIDKRTIINVQQVYNFSYQSDMLTRDENIVSVEVAVQYRISDPFAYLYNVGAPLQSLQQATASAVRQVVGQTDLDDILTTQREAATDKIQSQLRELLARYNTGLTVVQVTLQSTKPPEEVTDAFNDAIKAREDEQRYQNQAMAYASNVVPIAEGNAKRILAEAKAYRQQVALEASAQVAAFNALLPAYEKSPAVMRERIYLDTMENVLQHSSKVLLATDNNRNMLYLPLDKLNPEIKPGSSYRLPVYSVNGKVADIPSATKNSDTVMTYPSGYFGDQGDQP